MISFLAGVFGSHQESLCGGRDGDGTDQQADRASEGDSHGRQGEKHRPPDEPGGQEQTGLTGLNKEPLNQKAPIQWP